LQMLDLSDKNSLAYSTPPNKARSIPRVEHLTMPQFTGKLLVSLEGFRLALTNFAGTNGLAYFAPASVTKKKSFVK
jgi:hypothetical protein